MAEERHITVTAGDLDSLDAALSWAVQVHDREFTGATMMKIQVEQILVSEGDGSWVYEWTASVSGCTHG